MAYPSFAPDHYANTGAAPGTSTNVALPGGAGPTVLITNLSAYVVYVVLGDANATAGQGAGLAIAGGSSIALTVGSATNIAFYAAGGAAILNMARGT